MAIVELEDALDFLKLSSPKEEEETILEALCDEISEAIEDYCGRKFESQSLTEDYDGLGTRILMLQQYPIVSVTTVTRTKVDAADTQVVVASTEYNINSEPGILLMHQINHVDSSVWVKGEQNYAIVYVAGYSADDMPKAIVNACKQWIAVVFQKAKHNLFAIQSSNIGDETINYLNEAMPPMVKSMLTKHRKLA